LTVEQLWLLDEAVILHVRAPSAGLQYRHWVLFLGFDGENVKLYDPPRDVGTVSVAQLLSMWDGMGIVVHRSGAITSPTVPIPLWFALFFVDAAVLIQLLSRWLHGWKLVVPVVLALSAAAHIVLPHGFLRAPSAVANVQRLFSPAAIPIIDLDQTKQLLASGDCLLVDARLTRAFAEFHLPGAINIPVAAGYLSLNYKASSMGQHRAVVVYCQSKDCEWADEIAIQLAARGVRNIFIFRGGANEWQAMNPHT
jgi:rhodanese-related sulfurtransferase